MKSFFHWMVACICLIYLINITQAMKENITCKKFNPFELCIEGNQSETTDLARDGTEVAWDEFRPLPFITTNLPFFCILQ